MKLFHFLPPGRVSSIWHGSPLMWGLKRTANQLTWGPTISEINGSVATMKVANIDNPRIQRALNRRGIDTILIDATGRQFFPKVRDPKHMVEALRTMASGMKDSEGKEAKTVYTIYFNVATSGPAPDAIHLVRHGSTVTIYPSYRKDLVNG